MGDPKRIALVAADLVAHFEKRVEAMDGKAMIVCMSRRICVDLYNALIKLRPEWEAETLKVVMTGSAEDGLKWVLSDALGPGFPAERPIQGGELEAMRLRQRDQIGVGHVGIARDWMHLHPRQVIGDKLRALAIGDVFQCRQGIREAGTIAGA